MSDNKQQSTEEMFEKALDIAEKHMDAALDEAGDDLSAYAAVAMIEVAVNQAVEMTSHEDVIDMVRDLLRQIEKDAKEQG